MSGIKRLVSGRPVAYYPELARVVGGPYAAILLQQLAHWQGEGDGWVFRTQEELEKETALTPEQQYTARRALRQKDLLEEKHDGLPRRLYYRPLIYNLEPLLQTGESREQVSGNPGNKLPGSSETTLKSINESKLPSEEGAGEPPSPTNGLQERRKVSAQLVALLAEETKGLTPLLTAGRKKRYAREFTEALKEHDFDELSEAVHRVADRWEDFQLSTEQALRDNQQRKARRKEQYKHPQADRGVIDKEKQREIDEIHRMIMEDT